MVSSNLSFGKIASTPTKTAWSQAYNAGGLFVVLSLRLTNPEKEHVALTIIGKNFINDLEAEFFTLEEKNVKGIHTALEKVMKEIPESVDLTSIIAFSKEESLYLFLIGNGAIFLKRQERIGTILSQTTCETRTIHTASGHLKPHDTVLLASQSFREAITDKKLTDALSEEEIDEIVETLTPHIHKLDEGSASAIVFRFHGEQKSEALTSVASALSETDDSDEPEIQKKNTSEYSPSDSLQDEELSSSPSLEEKRERQRPFFARLSLPKRFASLSHRRKIFLTIAIILIIVLFGSIFFSVQTQQANERKELFDEIYPQALKNYEEGEGLLRLNKALAREELEEAKTLLAKTDGKFPKGTEEAKQTEELKGKIEDLLSQVGDSRAIDAKEISADDTLLLSVLLPNGRLASVEDETSVYYLTDSEIGSIRKASKSEQTLIENNSDWGKAVGIGKFGSNFYVLDQEEGILKFVPSGNDYSSSHYLTEDVDLSHAVSMAIDASIYVLFEKGTLKKFNRGKEESFTVSGLETPLKKPLQIVTNEEMDNLYILDVGTARIVKINKKGSFQEEFQTAVLQTAKAVAISQDEKKAYILSGDKLYEISL